MHNACYREMMTTMTDELRAHLRAELARRKIRQRELAEELGMSRTYLSNLLNGQRGQVSEKWQRLLDYLGLELALKTKE